MTIDDAIRFCKIESERMKNQRGSEFIQELQLAESSKRFEQMAEWLRELKAYREAEEEINRKMKSGQWSDAVVYGMSKASVIIEKCRFAHNCKGVNADDSN